MMEILNILDLRINQVSATRMPKAHACKMLKLLVEAKSPSVVSRNVKSELTLFKTRDKQPRVVTAAATARIQPRGAEATPGWGRCEVMAGAETCFSDPST